MLRKLARLLGRGGALGPKRRCFLLLQLSDEVELDLAKGRDLWQQHFAGIVGLKSEFIRLDEKKSPNDFGKKIQNFGFSHWFSKTAGYDIIHHFHPPASKAHLRKFRGTPRGAWRSDLVQVLNQEAKNSWTGRCVGRVSMVKFA